MSVYLRKSIVKSGPFHVYLNKSGIGVSAGVPGLRVGKGPRGSYVRMGKGGVYYRKTLGSSSGRKNGSSHRSEGQNTDSPARHLVQPESSEVHLQEIGGATVLELAEANPTELTGQLNDASNKSSLMYLIVLCYMLIITIPLGIWLRAKEAERRSVIVFYDINDGHLQGYETLVNSFALVTQCAAKWCITASGRVSELQQWKTNAGASNLLKRSSAKFDTKGPSILKTNIAVPSLRHAKQSVFLLPDRVLVQQGWSFADLSYAQCGIEGNAIRFIEEDRPPRDSKQVGSTWRYVNKNGGPDKRYKNNRQIPIMQYGSLRITSSTGLDLLWEMSRADAAVQLASAARSLR
jgi:hypothetical protein